MPEEKTQSSLNQTFGAFKSQLSWQLGWTCGIFGQSREILYKNVSVGKYFLAPVQRRFGAQQTAVNAAYLCGLN